jgi:hypothetical protein
MRIIIFLSIVLWGCGDSGSVGFMKTKNGTYKCKVGDSFSDLDVTIIVTGDVWNAKIIETYNWGDSKDTYLNGEIRDNELYNEESLMFSIGYFSDGDLIMRNGGSKCRKI